MTKDELKKMNRGDIVYRIARNRVMTCEIVVVDSCILGERKGVVEIESGLTIVELIDAFDAEDLKEIYKEEKDAHYAILEEIKTMERSIKDRLIELGE